LSGLADISNISIQEWVSRIIDRDVRAIARAISSVENCEDAARQLITALREELSASAKQPIVVGITGPAGSGKSTLTDALIGELRKGGHTVGVLAIDPTSAISGGALLGDRIRMQAYDLDRGVLIRSMATRGATGGIANATSDAITVLQAAGKDYILVETLGVGQDEIAVAQLADVTVLVLAPRAGDEVQAMKAGIMEVADIIVLNKTDDPAMTQLESDIRESLQLRNSGDDEPTALPPVIKTVATEGRGVPELRIAIDAMARTVSSRSPKKALHGPALGEVALDHLGVAVGSLAESLKFYGDMLGMTVMGNYDIPHESTRVAMLPAGDARIELLEATEADSPIGRFLAKRGPGLHHICLRVLDLKTAIAKLKEAGARLVQDVPQVGASGHRYIFVHPSSAGGVLLELVQAEAHT
jgi:LAO/AO transport system kinase